MELYIDIGDRERNEAVFSALHQDREAIEQAVGFGLEWETLEGKQAKRISTYAPMSATIESSAQDLQQIQNWAVNAMIQFVKVFRPRLKALP